VSSAGSQPRGRQSRARRELGAQVSLDSEGLFDIEGMDEASQDPEHFHSEDEADDTDGESYICISHSETLVFSVTFISVVSCQNSGYTLFT
jgi:hypothetical protein